MSSPLLNSFTLKVFRVIIKFFISILTGLVVADYAAYVFVRLYANSMGVPLCNLSEDYGMGMIGMFLQIGVFFLTVICMFVLFLCRTKRRNS
jgi:hypothetical protein